jgi:hypothetical protein
MEIPSLRGLKPIVFPAVFGTTKVVPFQTSLENDSFLAGSYAAGPRGHRDGERQKPNLVSAYLA